MKCTLMHKRIEVADLELDEITGFIIKIYTVSEPEHLPLGVAYKKGIADRAALNEWWADRAIPASRSGVRDALEYLGIPNTKALLVRCFGLSLSDHYWIKPQEADICWDKINFFQNDFSEDIGDALFGRAKKTEDFDFSSPDNTSDGCLKKRWKIVGGKRCLIKGGSGLEKQQTFNEVIATRIMERLSVNHVPYTLMWDGGEPYSVCEDFVDESTELVPAWRIMQTQKKDNNVSVYRHFLNCCTALGAGDMIPSLDKMIVLDYIIANEDRHLNNFGLLRDAETLEWLGFAPIYDSGSSLGYDKRVIQIRRQSDIVCKPFKKTHADQIKLVSDFSWIDFGKLADVPDMIYNYLTEKDMSEFIGEDRALAVCETVRKRIAALRGIANTQQMVEDTADGDVDRNVAEDYTGK